MNQYITTECSHKLWQRPTRHWIRKSCEGCNTAHSLAMTDWKDVSFLILHSYIWLLTKNKYTLYLTHLLGFYFLSEIQNPAMCLRGNGTYTGIIRQCVTKMTYRIITWHNGPLFTHREFFWYSRLFIWTIRSRGILYMLVIKLILYIRIWIQLCCTLLSRYVLMLSP